MIDIEEGSGNVYEDLQTPDAGAMYVKARLASKIGDIIRHRHLTQQQSSQPQDHRGWCSPDYELRTPT